MHPTPLKTRETELKNAAPETPEQRHHVFSLKKKVVDVLLEEATIDEHKEIHVKIRVDLLKIAGGDPESGDSMPAVETRLVGTYTRKFDFYRTLAVVVTL